jgi:hypothetical protein
MSNFSGCRFVSEMAGGYIVFSSLAVVGHLAKPMLGEVADFLAMSAVVWPYPLMLALQTWVSPGSLSWAFLAGGLVITVLSGLFLQRRFPILSQETWWSHAAALTVWCVPLVILEAIAVAAVWAMGYPIGE